METNCKYCKYFDPNLFKFVNMYLDNLDFDKLQSRDVILYYKNLIDHFLKTEFVWENGRPEGISYKKIEDLPYKMKANAIDCLGVMLGLGPKSSLDGISFLYNIYLKYYKE